MAGVTCYYDSGDVAVSPGSNTPKTVSQLIPASDQRILVKRVVVTVKFPTGAAPTNESALIELCRQNTATSTTAGTVRKVDDDINITPRTIGTNVNDAGEPSTTVNNGAAERIFPSLGGRFEWEALRREDMVPITPNDTNPQFGVRITPDHATSSRDYRVQIWFEE